MGTYKIKIKETIATVVAEEKYLVIAQQEVLRQRNLLEEYIERDPTFLASLQPHDVLPDAPEIVRKMALASARVGVGPMAAVAGAIAECAVKAMVSAGARHAVFDNGGDIAMHIDRPVVVGIYSGEKGIQHLGFKVLPGKNIIAICTSSASVGPSLSFGRADAATVISDSAFLADAAATALGNSVFWNNSESMTMAMSALMIEGIHGICVMIDDKVGRCGSLPEFVKVTVKPNLISRG